MGKKTSAPADIKLSDHAVVGQLGARAKSWRTIDRPYS